MISCRMDRLPEGFRCSLCYWPDPPLGSMLGARVDVEQTSSHLMYIFPPSCLPFRIGGRGLIRGRTAEHLRPPTALFILLLNDTCISSVLSREKGRVAWLQTNCQRGFRPCPRENGIKPENPAKRGHPKCPRLKMGKQPARLLLLR
jgi:hypothetical protein